MDNDLTYCLTMSLESRMTGSLLSCFMILFKAVDTDLTYCLALSLDSRMTRLLLSCCMILFKAIWILT
jgi:hypothetical protein